MGDYGQEQARDERGRWASGGMGPSQARAERVKLNQQLDARNRSKTFGFGPAARSMEKGSMGGGGGGGGSGGGGGAAATGAHTAGIHKATQGKTLAQASAAGTVGQPVASVFKGQGS